MKIALIGYGKMGKAIESVAINKGHTICLKVDYENLHDLNLENIKCADVVIEFTGPESAPQNILKCFQFGVPVVSGSTGWLEKIDEINKACLTEKATFLYSSNFSIGVNIFFELNSYLAGLMNPHKNYAIEVNEIHHTQKKDAPSGTAITIAQGIIEKIPGKKEWVNKPSDNTEQLSIISHRIDPAPGTHSVKYSSEIDDIEIIHTAHNRMGFASGAVLAAEFISGKIGIFEMKNVLGF